MTRTRSIPVAAVVLALATVALVPAAWSRGSADPACGDVITADVTLTKNLDLRRRRADRHKWRAPGSARSYVAGRRHGDRREGAQQHQWARAGRHPRDDHRIRRRGRRQREQCAPRGSRDQEERLEWGLVRRSGVLRADRQRHRAGQHDRFDGEGIRFRNEQGAGSRISTTPSPTTTATGSWPSSRATTSSTRATRSRVTAATASTSPTPPRRFSTTGSRRTVSMGCGSKNLAVGDPELADRDRATHNGGHGLNVLTPGIPDGGGNRASGNALDPQCVNIAC